MTLAFLLLLSFIAGMILAFALDFHDTFKKGGLWDRAYELGRKHGGWHE